MQNITLDQLAELENPEGLSVQHNPKNPTICRIVDANGKVAHHAQFTSRAQAEYRLYLLLTEPERFIESKKKSKKPQKEKADK